MSRDLTGYASRRDTRIVFEELTKLNTVDAAGHVDESLDSSWKPWLSTVAEIHTKGSREYKRGEQLADEVTHIVKVLYTRQLSAKLLRDNSSRMRIRIDNRRLNIDGPPVDVDEQHEFIRFTCIES